MMVCYWIIFFCSFVLINAQQPRDEMVECQTIDLTPYQLDQMNLTSQEQLVNHSALISLPWRKTLSLSHLGN